MSKVNGANIELKIIEYRNSENETCCRAQNSKIKKLFKYKHKLSWNYPLKTISEINRLLDNDDIRISSFAAIWAINCNVYVDRSLGKIIKMSKSEEYKISSLNAEIFVENFLLGKYGGWKRDERYPDLSEYEDKMIDE